MRLLSLAKNVHRVIEEAAVHVTRDHVALTESVMNQKYFQALELTI